MPCSDSGPSSWEIQEEVRIRNLITRLACDRCREIESRGGEVPEWAIGWWLQHKQSDAEQERYNAQKRRESEIRQKAISKLTEEERNELGI